MLILVIIILIGPIIFMNIFSVVVINNFNKIKEELNEYIVLDDD